MDVEHVARKLEPLMPKEIRRWLRTRDIAEPDLKNLIDKQILSQAHKRLGDYHRKILLSLPPRRVAAGAINLGTIIYDNEKWPAGISHDDLLQNMLIVGRSGAGKTNVAFHLLNQLSKQGMPFLFLDWKRTARHLLPYLHERVRIYTPGRSLSPFPFNPFIVPPGIEPNVYINHLIDVMSDALTLGDGSRLILQRAISGCYKQGNQAPTVKDILAAVQQRPCKGRERGWQITALRAVESLAFADLTTSDRDKQIEAAGSLLSHSTIIELDALSVSMKKFLVPMLCLWLYSVQLSASDREQLKLAIFLEEAHHTIYRQEKRAKESTMNMLLRQCREIGVCFVVIDQHPHLISSAAIGNCFISICLNQKDPTDISKAAGLSLLVDDEKRYLSMLPVGHGIVKLQDGWRRPFLIRFPYVKVRKGFVSDGVLSRVLNGSLTLSALRRAVERDSTDSGHFRMADMTLDDAHLRFLHDVIQHQDDGVDARYRRLGFSADKGNRIKLSLLQKGVLESQEVSVGRTRKLLLRPTTTAMKHLNLTKNIPDYGSLVHEYWKRFYSTSLTKQGFAVEVEAMRSSGGRVDVLVRMRDESFAVEVETGKSNAIQNVKRNLRAGFHRVIVVATDTTAMQAIERRLAKAGLLLPSRVRVILRGDKIALPSGSQHSE